MNFLLPFIISFGASLFLVPITIFFARKYGFVDDPIKHKHPAVLHKRIIPRAGGFPIFFAFATATLLLIPFSQKILGILLGGVTLVIIGLVDDKLNLNIGLRLLGQILAAIIVVAAGVGIAFITNPLSLFDGGLNSGVIRLDNLRVVFEFFGQHSILVWADIFAILWIVWVINMVNFSSGVDGQMPGIVLVALAVLFAASLRFSLNDPSQIVIFKLALIGAGATLGFLIFNFYPAKIFPGDSGSYFLGYLVAVLSILSGAKVGTAVLVMAIPLIDGVFTIVRRMASGKSPFAGDRGHLHHKLLELGWGQRRIALFYWLLCAILGATALALNSTGKLFAAIVISIIALGGLVWLNMNLPPKAQK